MFRTKFFAIAVLGLICIDPDISMATMTVSWGGSGVKKVNNVAGNYFSSAHDLLSVKHQISFGNGSSLAHNMRSEVLFSTTNFVVVEAHSVEFSISANSTFYVETEDPSSNLSDCYGAGNSFYYVDCYGSYNDSGNWVQLTSLDDGFFWSYGY